MTMNPTPLRILLSEGSSTSARQVLYGIGEGRVIDVLDPSPWCQCRFSRLVRRRIACPKIATNPVDYVRFVANLVRRESYEVLFPTHEQVYAFSKFRDEFSKDVGLAVPEFEVLRRVQNKAEFCQLMTELGLPIPATTIISRTDELANLDSYPLYLKLIHSTASLGVKLVASAPEAIATMRHFESLGLWKPGEPVVLQQPAPGRQAEVTAVFQQGRLVAAGCADVLATGIGGGPALRRTAHHPSVISHMELFGEKLNWHGPVAIEYFYDPATDQPYYIEANPRVGESLNRLVGGVNVCEAIIRVSLGEHVPRYPDTRPGLLTHNGFVVMIAAAYNGANRRQLVKQLWTHWTTRSQGESEMTRLGEDWMSLVPATAVISLLLISPRAAHKLAHGTVENYSLPSSAAHAIDDLESSTIFGDVASDSSH